MVLSQFLLQRILFPSVYLYTVPSQEDYPVLLAVHLDLLLPLAWAGPPRAILCAGLWAGNFLNIFQHQEKKTFASHVAHLFKSVTICFREL